MIFFCLHVFMRNKNKAKKERKRRYLNSIRSQLTWSDIEPIVVWLFFFCSFTLNFPFRLNKWNWELIIWREIKSNTLILMWLGTQREFLDFMYFLFCLLQCKIKELQPVRLRMHIWHLIIRCFWSDAPHRRDLWRSNLKNF